jgi:hypothetical protein
MYSRITSTKGEYGDADSPSQHRPTNTCAPRSRAYAPASSARRVLPIPGSPATITNDGCPPKTASIAVPQRDHLLGTADEPSPGQTSRGGLPPVVFELTR